MKRAVVSSLLALVVAGCASKTGKEMLMNRTLIGLRVPVHFNVQAYDIPHTHDSQGIIGEKGIMCEPYVGPYYGFFGPYKECPPTNVKITNDTNDEEAWATKTRFGGNLSTNFTFGIAFMSRERCEAFRAEHPTYTKPHEVCERVYFKRI